MALTGAGAAVLTNPAALEAAVEEFLLTLELVLQLCDLGLLGLHQFLEAAFKLLFELGFFFLRSGFPVFLLLLEVINLFLEHLNMQLKLLLNFDVVAYLCFVVLKLLLVLLRW